MKQARFIVGAMAALCLACSLEDTSSVKVIGGTVTNDYPAVVMWGGGCSGTFVSSSTLITAAHCMQLPKDFNGRQPKKQIINTKFPLGAQTVNYYDTANDLAVLVFEAGTAPATMPLSTASPGSGQSADIVGYGCTQGFSKEGTGTKRKGNVSITNVGVGYILSEGQAIGGCSGDSGGALVVGGALTGVSSTSTMQPGNVTTAYTDLASAAARTFLAEAVQQGADIPGVASSGSSNPNPADPSANPGGSPDNSNPQSQQGDSLNNQPDPGQLSACKLEQRNGGYFCGSFGPFGDQSLMGFTCGDNGVNDLCKR